MFQDLEGPRTAHRKHPHIKQEPDQRPRRHFVLHHQKGPGRLQRPADFLQAGLLAWTLQLVECMGAGHRIEGCFAKREAARIALDQIDVRRCPRLFSAALSMLPEKSMPTTLI